MLPAMLAILVASLAALPAIAQDEDDSDRRVEIRIEDGRIWVNGEEVPEGTALQEYLDERGFGDITVTTDGGDNRTIVVTHDDHARPNVYFDRKSIRRPDDVVVARPNFMYNFDGAFDTLKDLDLAVDLHDGFGGIMLGATSPEMAEKERESRDLARRAREATGSERAQLERELEALLSDIFEMKLEVRRERVERLQDRLVEQQEALAERENDRAEIVERRKAELLGQNSRYDW